MICLSEGFLCLVLSSWAICLASLSLALWVAFRSSCVDAQGHSSHEENQQWQSIIYSYVSVFQILKDVIEQTFGVALWFPDKDQEFPVVQIFVLYQVWHSWIIQRKDILNNDKLSEHCQKTEYSQLDFIHK